MSCVCVSLCTDAKQSHLFEQSEDVKGEKTHDGGDDEAGLLQVRHVAFVGTR